MVKHRFYVIFSISILLSACGLAANSAATSTPTLPAETPTAMPSPRPTLNHTATAEVIATEKATFFEEVVEPDLRLMGFNPRHGELVFSKEFEWEIDVAEGVAGYFDLMNPLLVSQDFVMSIDITWDSETGVAGCGLVFRGDQDLSSGKFARFITMRLSGAPLWTIDLWRDGNFQADLTGRVQASRLINVGAGSTNHYLLAVEGTSVVIYANGYRLGAATLTYDVQIGQFAFFAYQDSGATNCTFSNIWVWELPAENPIEPTLPAPINAGLEQQPVFAPNPN